jgi:hypothetical protein
MEHAQCGTQESPFADHERPDSLQFTSPDSQTRQRVRRFRLSGTKLFLLGLELWCYLQFHWFSGSFRLQAVGAVLLAYWILGALFMTRE